jgi:hypothetical protein
LNDSFEIKSRNKSYTENISECSLDPCSSKNIGTENRTGAGTVGTENFLLITEELFKCRIILNRRYQSTIAPTVNFAYFLRLDGKEIKID